MAKVVEFVIEFDPICRLRERFVKSGGAIREFTVQLEVQVKEKWMAIRRYDTAHGFMHCDIIHPDGKVDKEPLPGVNFNDGLNIAEHDLRGLWRFYRDEFLREVEKYGKR